MYVYHRIHSNAAMLTVQGSKSRMSKNPINWATNHPLITHHLDQTCPPAHWIIYGTTDTSSGTRVHEMTSWES